MATLTILTPSLTDQDLAPVACASGGDQVLNSGDIVLYFKSTHTSDQTVTMVTSGTVKTSAGTIAIADVTLVVSQNEEKAVGPFEPAAFNDSNGYLQLTYSGVTNLTVKPIRVT